jgi:hypothetical protein
MSLVDDNGMIKQLASYAANHSLHVWVLPRRSGGNDHLVNPHISDALPKRSTVDTIPVAQEIAGRSIPRKRVDHLLRRPRRRGMLCHVDVYDPSPFRGEDHEREEHLVRERRHHKEVQGDQIFDVVVEEGLPRRRGWIPGSDPVLLDRRFGHVDTDLT